jgi:hypothetical protein
MKTRLESGPKQFARFVCSIAFECGRSCMAKQEDL